MVIRTGKSVSKGIAIGPLYIVETSKHEIVKKTAADTAAELKRFENAKKEAIGQLEKLAQKAMCDVGEAEAMIFTVHQLLLEDPDYNASVRGLIEGESVTAEYAVFSACKQLESLFLGMDDEYMRERAADIRDISERVMAVLSGTAEENELSAPSIILAEDLAPSQTIQFKKEHVLALVTQKGSVNSHTAILARTMKVPALVGADLEVLREYQGKMAAVDGFSGQIYLEPDEETLEKLRQAKRQYEEQETLLLDMKSRKTVTKSGKSICLYANISGPQDVDAVLEQGAEGIGLFRSEFLYLGRNDFPSEEEQFEAYKDVLVRMNGKKVIIRTLDIGADKRVDYLELPTEENPALGLRAIRVCLTREEVFRTQLRALYRASVYGNLSIMFPMIISVNEVLRIKSIVEDVKAELEQNGVECEDVELGIMIETPAAAVISDLLAPHVDFFSIGTNDLSQYTLAIDRQNQALESFFAPHHEAVLRLIQMTVDNAHKNGIWCGICGELAADPALTEGFVRMGVDELSVNPGAVLEIRKCVREC